MSDDLWAGLVDSFADGAYATVKGYVRTYVMHQQLLEHMPGAPATVLDVGGGAGHQSFPLAEAGYEVTLLDSPPQCWTGRDNDCSDFLLRRRRG
jgi:protein-L-isoaspartate O-methyltransferase